MAEIEATTVIRAVHELHDRTGDWPTAERIATYLKVDQRDVQRHLLRLRRKRILVDRWRHKQRVWMDWRAGAA